MTFAKGSLGAAAMYYAVELGWAVFPLVPRDKLPLFSKAQGGQGLKDASKDPAQIAAWWTDHPEANIGVVTGEASGLVVVDVDGDNGEEALASYGELTPTIEAYTGKGRHLFFARGSLEIRNSAGKLGPQLDVRGEGGYVVAAPSVHPNGHRYQWAKGAHPGARTPAALPQSIVDRLSGVVGAIAPTQVALRTAAEVAITGVDEGSRNQALAEYIGRILALGCRELEALELARGINATKFRPPLPDAEVESVVRSIANAHHRNRGNGTRVATPASAPQAAIPLSAVDRGVFEEMGVRAQAPIDALPMPWPAWNRACRMHGGSQGVARGWHTVIAGGSGAGKSLLALNVTANALRNGHSVGWVSLEMSREQLLLRLLGIATGRLLRELEPGPAHDAQAFRAAHLEFAERMESSGAQLFIAERPSRDMATVDRLLREAIDAGCRLLIVDYFQLINVPGSPRLDDAMRQASAMVQGLAFQFEVNTLALSQFNRSTTANNDASPTIHGLAGSSAIENDADQIGLIDHTGRQTVHTGKTFQLLLDKNRHGPTGAMTLHMDTHTLQITERMESALSRNVPQLALADRPPRRDYYEGREN